MDRVAGALNYDVTARGKRSIAVDLKKPDGAKIIKDLSSKFDVLLEPFRTGKLAYLWNDHCVGLEALEFHAGLYGLGMQLNPLANMR